MKIDSKNITTSDDPVQAKDSPTNMGLPQKIDLEPEADLKESSKESKEEIKEEDT